MKRRIALVLLGILWVFPAQSDPKIKIKDQTESLFFENGRTPTDIDYADWLQKNRLRLHIDPRKFNVSHWDIFAPIPDLHKDLELTRPQAEALLLRFQKPGGYELQHAPLMQAILSSRIAKDSPELIAGAMENILATSPQQYDHFIDDNPNLRKISVKQTKSRNPFRSEAEDKHVYKADLAYVDAQINRLLPDEDPLRETKLAAWTNLRPLSSIWWRMSQEEREQHETPIMESLAYSAAHDGTFPSIDVHVNEGVINPLFDDPAVARTIIDVIHRGKTLTPVLLSTHKIEGLAERRNPYGYYTAKLPPIHVEPDDPKTRKTFEWRTGGRTFTATIDYMPLDRNKQIIPDDPGPNYEALWTPKGLNGKTLEGEPKTLTLMALFGSTLSKDAPWIIRDSYLKFFEARGFKPEGEDEPIENVKEYVKQQIISGQTSVLDKEAHSAGDDQDIVRVGKKGKLKTLSRIGPDGRKVVMKIVYSDPDEKTEDIANWEFGRWLRARARIAHKQLLDLNLSCWANKKAEYEIPEVHNKILAEIISFTVADFFFDRKDNMMRILYDAIINNENYDQIREDMKQDPDYVKRTADYIEAPDRYGKKILGRQPVKVEIKMKDDRGRIYRGDDFEPRIDDLNSRCAKSAIELGRKRG